MSKISLAISATGHTGITGKGHIKAIIVNTHSSGVISLVDSPNGLDGRVILAPYTLTTGAQVIPLHKGEYYEGIGFILTSGSATIQIVTEPN